MTPAAGPLARVMFLADVSRPPRTVAEANALRRSGWSVEIVDAPSPRALAFEYPPALRALREGPLTAFSPRHLADLAEILRRPPQLIVATSLATLPAALAGAAVHGCHVVYDIDEVYGQREEFRAPGIGGYLLDLERALAGQADALVASTEALAEVAEVRLAVPRPEVVRSILPASPINGVAPGAPLRIAVYGASTEMRARIARTAAEYGATLADERSVGGVAASISVFDSDASGDFSRYWSAPPALYTALASNSRIIAPARGGVADVLNSMPDVRDRITFAPDIPQAVALLLGDDPDPEDPPDLAWDREGAVFVETCARIVAAPPKAIDPEVLAQTRDRLSSVQIAHGRLFGTSPSALHTVSRNDLLATLLHRIKRRSMHVARRMVGSEWEGAR